MSLDGHIDRGQGRRVVMLDKATRAQMLIEVEHWMIHQGCAFKANFRINPITSGEYMAVGFTTPDNALLGDAHMVVAWAAEADAEIDLIEGPTLAAGTSLVAYNRKRSSTNATNLINLASYDNAGVSLGTVIDFDETWSDKRETTAARGSLEWELDGNTTYAVRLLANANSGGIISLRWYEWIDLP